MPRRSEQPKRDRRAVRIRQAEWRDYGGGADLPDVVIAAMYERLKEFAFALGVDPCDPDLPATTAKRLLLRALTSGFDLSPLLQAEAFKVVRPGGVRPGTAMRDRVEFPPFTEAVIAAGVRLVQTRPRGQSIRAVLEPLADAAGGAASTRALRLEALYYAVKWRRHPRRR